MEEAVVKRVMPHSNEAAGVHGPEQATGIPVQSPFPVQYL